MNKKDFFKLYIPALEQALLNDNINYGFHVKGPDWYITDGCKRNKIDLFEEENFEKYKSFFQNVSLYFDAKSHGFKEINGIKIEEHKKILKKQILKYRVLLHPKHF